jgi:hypothetical protein
MMVGPTNFAGAPQVLEGIYNEQWSMAPLLYCLYEDFFLNTNVVN